MMAGSSEQKTEKATPRRLKKLRQKNTVIRSTELAAAGALVALVAIAPWLMSSLATTSIEVTVDVLPKSGQVTATEALILAYESGMSMVLGLALPLLVVIAASLFVGLIIARGRPNPWALKPQFSILNPKNGVKRVFGTQGLLEVGKGVLKLSAVALSFWFLVTPILDEFLTDSLEGWLTLLGSVAMRLLWASAVVAVVSGLIDLAFNIKRFRKQSKMTKTELKQEMKGDDGDPLLKAARRARQLALSRTRMIEDVTSAAVVLVNPTHIAIALRYQPGDDAPVVVARGAGVIAQRIREKALEHDIPIRRDVPLARALYKSCRTGQYIPVEMYHAVALVLAALHAASRKVHV